MKTKKSIFSWILLASFVLGLAGLIVYYVNSTTGYYSGRSASTPILVLTIIGLVLEVVVFFLADKAKALRDLLVIGAGACLIVALCLFAMDRVNIAADVWFIPVNYPEAEEVSLNVALVGAVLYVLSILGLGIAGAGAKLTKQVLETLPEATITN